MGVYLFRIPCRRLPSLPRQREVCSSGSQAMSPYGARRKPHIADDTALVGSAYVPSSRHSSCKHGSALDFRDSCGKVVRRQFFFKASPFGDAFIYIYYILNPYFYPFKISCSSRSRQMLVSFPRVEQLMVYEMSISKERDTHMPKASYAR